MAKNDGSQVLGNFPVGLLIEFLFILLIDGIGKEEFGEKKSMRLFACFGFWFHVLFCRYNENQEIVVACLVNGAEQAYDQAHKATSLGPKILLKIRPQNFIILY